MSVEIVCHHLDLTEAIKVYIEDKVKKLEKIISPLPNVVFNLSLQSKHSHVAEISLTVNREFVKSIAESEDMYLSIDQAIEKGSRQLQKIREKMKEH